MRRVCLTIDTEFPDRPCRDPLGAFDRILDVLGAHPTHATFFVVGSWARANPTRAAAIAAAGHQVGNHSYSHCNLARLSRDGIVEDLTECRQALAEFGIETRPWFRAPYGELTSGRAVRRAVKRSGYRHVGWNVDSEDWQPVSPAQIAENALAQVKRRWPRTANVLFHSWPDSTPSALSLLIDELRASRAQFTTVESARRRGGFPRRSARPDPFDR